MSTMEKQTRQKCDRAVTRMAQIMLNSGAGMDMVLDRLLTFAVAHAVKSVGAFATAEMLRDVADNVERGAFAHLEPKSGKGN